MRYAVILSGGIGSRMGLNGMPKQYLEVDGKSILTYTLEKFQNTDSIDHIVIVAADQWQEKISQWILKYKVTKFLGFALPGKTRQSSILNGLRACRENSFGEQDIVIIHDAARPMVSEKMISDCLDAAEQYGGCMPVLPVTDTIYQSADGRNIGGLLDRSTLFAGQSPEAFRLKEYTDLNDSVSEEELNSYKGTSEIAYKYGIHIRLIPGDESNFKITTPKDLEKFERICKERNK